MSFCFLVIRRTYDFIFHHERSNNRSEQIPSVHILVVMAYKNNFSNLQYNINSVLVRNPVQNSQNAYVEMIHA